MEYSSVFLCSHTTEYSVMEVFVGGVVIQDSRVPYLRYPYSTPYGLLSNRSLRSTEKCWASPE
jgi:hypothetical protein